MSLATCFLRSIDNSHEPIEVKHGKEKFFGRGPESGIHDTRCSRLQVKIIPDCERREAKITQLGRNASGVNGMALTKDSTVTVKEGDRIELLIGKFPYVVEFEDPEREEEVEEEEGEGEGEDEKGSAEEAESQKDKLSESEEGGDGDSEEDLEPRTKKPRTSPSPSTLLGLTASSWESVDERKLLVYTHPDVKPSSSIASYDLDGTLIGTKSGGVFPKHKGDWKLLYPSVLPKLKEIHEKNYKIVVFTNQSGLSSKKTNEMHFKVKIEDIVRKINLPVQVFIATGYSYYRKPAIGMWEAMKERNGGVEIDMVKSFYVGDAAGREAGGAQKKKDFSHSDLLFAKNLNLHFETPEHHFLNKEMQPLRTTAFDPNSIPCDVPLCDPPWAQIISNKLELIILVGAPGSGKSHFVRTHLIPAGYVHVNRDGLGSWNRCVSVMETALKSRQKVVVDNTNPDVESRKRYITIAKNYTPLVRCFIMNTSLPHAKHNNKFRQLTNPDHAVITDVVINVFNSKYQEPSLEEGFTEILRINFWPTFKDPRHEKLYKLFLLDK